MASYTKKELAELDKLFADEKLLTQKNISKDIVKELEKLNEEKKKGTVFDDYTNGNYAKRLSLAKQLKAFDEGSADLSKDAIKNAGKSGSKSKQFGDQLKRQIPFVSDMNENYKSIKKNFRFLGKYAGPLAAFAVLAALALQTAKAVADTRKELGISVGASLKVIAANKVLAQQAKLYGLSIEDVTSAQTAIRNDLGASVKESIKLSLSFARTSAATGQTSDELATSLSIMESMSSASREVLLNQIRSNAAMIEAAGVAPSLVMKDIASNAEFFASFAKDGGQNLIMAGTAARKLGLNMAAVSATTESLLDFESSIEAQMEASVLLGRQLNLDRARQLALTGDQEGMMKEVLKQVGGEAEFNKMNVLQRRALAQSVGQSVENLSRLVRNNTATTTAGTVASTTSDPVVGVLSSHTSIFENMDSSLRSIKKGID